MHHRSIWQLHSAWKWHAGTVSHPISPPCFLNIFDQLELMVPHFVIYRQINGINTQGENIADNGGIRESFRVRHRRLSIDVRVSVGLTDCVSLWFPTIMTGLQIIRAGQGGRATIAGSQWLHAGTAVLDERCADMVWQAPARIPQTSHPHRLSQSWSIPCQWPTLQFTAIQRIIRLCPRQPHESTQQMSSLVEIAKRGEAKAITRTTIDTLARTPSEYSVLPDSRTQSVSFSFESHTRDYPILFVVAIICHHHHRHHAYSYSCIHEGVLNDALIIMIGIVWCRVIRIALLPLSLQYAPIDASIAHQSMDGWIFLKKESTRPYNHHYVIM